MRGADSYSESPFSTIRLEDCVPAKHLLRSPRIWMSDPVAKTDERFSSMYGGRPRGTSQHRTGEAEARDASSVATGSSTA